MSRHRAPAEGHSVGLTTIRTVGGVVPPDLVARVVAGDPELAGLGAGDYHLELGVTPREAANRAWSVLTGAWVAYREALPTRPEGDRATGLTRDKWLGVLLRELGFGRVPPTPAGGIVVDGRSFPVSHCWGDVPIHLLGWGVDLDRRTRGLAGAAERAPHAMVQELLNRSGEHLWALLASGATLRLLRDSTGLVGQAYMEFDLAAMFDGEVFSDFAVLYLLCHQSRFEPLDPEAAPQDCWLERWRDHTVESGVRALGGLRLGVREAIEVLGSGFLRQRPTPGCAPGWRPGATWVSTTITAPCCASSTGCCSASWPRTGACWPTPPPRQRPACATTTGSAPPACGASPPAAGERPTATCGRPCRSCSRGSGARAAGPSSGCRPWAGCSSTPPPTWWPGASSPTTTCWPPCAT